MTDPGTSGPAADAGARRDAAASEALWDLLAWRAASTPDALAAVDERDRTLSFAGWRDRALRVAAALAGRGIAAGTPLLWQLPTTFEALVLAAAASRLGAVQVPVLPFWRGGELAVAVARTRPRLLVVPRSFRGFDHAALAREVAAVAPGAEVLVLGDDEGLPESDPAPLSGCRRDAPPATAPADPDPVRWIFFTSGTTAEPKGALHSDATLGAAGRALVERLALRSDDRVALVFPVTHVGGIAWLLAGLRTGCAHVVVPVFDAARTVDVLARHGVTQATAGTVFHQAYLAEQRRRGGRPIFPRVRAFPGGGAPKPPDLHDAVKRELGGAGVVSGYGLTECPIATMSHVADPDAKRARSEGRPTAGVALRIVRADGGAAAPGEEGEIRVRGPQLFRGYVGAPPGDRPLDAEGFLRTGDLGRVDADGFLEVTGRVKDVIVRKGENVSAAEVEGHLLAHPAVADAAVIGLPDPEAGERCCAVVVPADPAAPPALGALTAFLAGRGLARQKWPERLECVDALPRNATGKVRKDALRDRFAGRGSAAPPNGPGV